MSSNKENEYFDSFPIEIKEIFLNEGFIPKNYFEADSFIKSLFKVRDIKDFNVFYQVRDITDNKVKKETVNISSDNFHHAFYTPIWKKLSLSQRLNVALWTFDFCKNQLKEHNNSILFFPRFNRDWKAGGCTTSDDNQVYINIQCILNQDNGYWVASIIAHELMHKKQDSAKLNMTRMKNIEFNKIDPYDLSSYASCSTLMTKETLTQLNRSIKKYYKKRFATLEKPSSWKSFRIYCYLSHPLEIAAYNYGAKISKQIAKANAEIFPACESEILKKQELYYYILLNSAEDYEKRNGYTMSHEDRITLSKIHNLLETQVRQYASLIKQQQKLKSDNVGEEELRKLFDKCEETSDKISDCIDILVDLFFNKEMPKNIPENLFDLLYDKDYLDEVTKPTF